jgi:plastocyanin
VIARRLGAALLAAGMAALVVTPVASGRARPVKRTVKVADYFLSPAKLTVPRRSTIVWKWANSNGDTHDVKLVKGPKGVKHFHSDYATSYFSFTRKLRVRGRYTVICTLHPDKMRQVIAVK